MANTTNLNLVKPAGTDYALVSVINGNMDIIDSKVGAIPANESAQSQITALNNQITSYENNTIISDAPSASNVTSGVETSLASISITKGKWIIVCGCAWQQNSTGYRWLGTGTQRERKSTMNAVSGDMTQQSFVYLYTASGSQTVELKGFQNCGSFLSAYPFIYAYKLL